MRNLFILNKGGFQPQGITHDNLSVLESSFDTITDSITVVLGSLDIGVIEVQKFAKDGTNTILASFNLETFDDEIISFINFADSNKLVFIFGKGDIITATYDPYTMDYQDTVVEIVGSIDNGIKQAQWSYDEETLVLVSKENKVILLSRDFSPINEVVLDTQDLKKSKHISVGWGKKETQFRGKGARAMEREALKSLKAGGLIGNKIRDPTMPYMVDKGMITDFDRQTGQNVEISWRGDCEYFAVSTVDIVVDPDDETKTIERRALRIYTRGGELDAASEPVDGMEQHLAWKPQGSLIASVQRKMLPQDYIEEEGEPESNEKSLSLIFFERNGLRHGEFDTRLPWDQKIKKLLWNCNSEILSICLEDKIQFWTTKNYHWYLKQEIYTPEWKFAKWHPEKDFTLMYADCNGINVLSLAYKITHGPTIAPNNDYGTVAVVDGTTVNITPFAIANVPPPIYFRDFEVKDNIVDVAISLSNEIYAVLTSSGIVIGKVESMNSMQKNGEHPSIVCEFSRDNFASDIDILRQIAFVEDNMLGVLLDSNNLSHIALIDLNNLESPSLSSVVETFGKVLLLKTSFDYKSLVYEANDCTVSELNTTTGQITEITKFPQIVIDLRFKNISSDENTMEYRDTDGLVAFGLTPNGKLYANDVLLTSAVTSMEITDKLLLFTTAQHNLQFVHLHTANFKPLPVVDENVSDERVRSIERGSILVSVIPSKSAVVLQAPRGNVETIYPRIMVLSGVRQDILHKNYKSAFITCRTHRINLDILHDYDTALFYDNLEHFINDIGRVDYLDLFISCLCEEDVAQTKYKETINSVQDASFGVVPAPPTEMELYIKNKFFDSSKSKVNKICKAMLEVFLSKKEYMTKYLQPIITAYACQKPPDLKSALALIEDISDEQEKDSMVTYICFLQDVNVVYKVALSLYDVGLSLAIAQKSQLDPKEYLPFLQTLQDATEPRRKFMIDDHLENYDLALTHLVSVEADEKVASEEVIDYIQVHELFKFALGLFRHNEAKQNQIYSIYADKLVATQQYAEAAIIYEMLDKFHDSMDAFVSGKRWKEALSIAVTHFPKDVKDIAESLVTALNYEHKYGESAQIELKYLKNIKESVRLFCKSYNFDESILVCCTENRKELIEELVDPGLDEAFGIIAELLADCKGQVNSQLKRLRELREKKSQDPYAFYGQEGDQADDVSIAPSETSTKESFFTRYTGKTGGTAKTGVSRRTAKNKRREERKRARGKKGTIYEEEYLIRSIGRLVERVTQTEQDAIKTIEGLLRRHKIEQAYQIQKNFIEVLDLLRANITEIYNLDEKDRERIDENGEVYHIPEIPVPEIKEFPKLCAIDF
ncbi:probable Elongator complex protein 1 [Saccharomycodes ludwigii]|uniref:Elongator complex protein 1 n=1 Tax=Saccharomycodes ludwigii TaxID=36035 RepID=A0A376B147_9ASCO|nr:probable Elongator complex protein 1 [Saccharomycodes ludwigii]